MRQYFQYSIFSLLLIGIAFSACNDDSSQSEEKNKKTVNSSSASQSKSNLTVQDLSRASLQGDKEKVQEALEEVDLHATDEGGRTPLMLSSYNGHTEVVQLLLDQGARVNDRDAQGRTPLLFAASGSFPETVKILLEHNADPNVTDQLEGWSPLMFAAAEGHEHVVQILLEYDADVSLEDKDGESAHDFASNGNHDKIAELIEKRANN